MNQASLLLKVSQLYASQAVAIAEGADDAYVAAIGREIDWLESQIYED